MNSCFTSCTFAARTLDFAVKFRFVFRYEAVVFRRYVLALLSAGLLQKFQAYLVFLSLIWNKNPRPFSFFQEFRVIDVTLCSSSCNLISVSLPRDWHIEIFYILDMSYFSTQQSNRRNKKLFEWVLSYLNSTLKFKFRAFCCIDQSEHSDWIWIQKLAPEK